MHDLADERGAALLAALDDAQLAAVTTPSTLVAVIASAGAGKTRVLTRRIAHRVVTGSADARHTLALTFTREAAGELRRRLRRLGMREPVTAGTFHAVARDVLHQRWQDLGRPIPKIVDDRHRLLHDIADGDPVAVLAPEVEWAAARGVTAGRYVIAARDARRSTAVPSERIAAAIGAYEQLKRRRGVIDLDDLLSLTVAELDHDPDWADGVRWRFRHLLVDEAQDLNPVQHRLLRLLAGGRDDLFLVGDPTQAIYGFNGSDPTLLTDISSRFSGVEVIHLPTNHRSTPQIVAAGMHVLRVTEQPADSVSGRADGRPIEIRATADADDEAAHVARLVRTLDPGLARNGHVAVLARTNAQLPRLVRALEAAHLPVRRQAIVPGTPLAAMVRAATLQPSSHRLREWATDNFEPAATAETDETAAMQEAARRVAAAVLEYLREHPFGDGAGLRTWIATTSPFSDGADTRGVEVLTFHAAKGREWNTVVVTGAETGLVPHRSATTIGGKEEEARLLHVALTRATDHLVVTWAARRGNYGRRISPFLVGLDSGPEPVAAIPSELRRPRQPPDPRLESLRHWRDAAARGAGVLPDELCTDAQLTAIVAADPMTSGELAAATGFGELTAARLFAAVRAALGGPN
ncbi:MAG: ATP-dependent DNA helicase UvrD2 [Actinomycetota bacterium]|nr:UvrD-helicase domain-containing protein [Acidimicrobiia bacterium]MDQ3470758.1 ATP-dependent DNA helicase UvrD2 [Actinomycetota bacterium]